MTPEEMRAFVEKNGTYVQKQLYRAYDSDWHSDWVKQRERIQIYKDCVYGMEQKRRRDILANPKAIAQHYPQNFTEYFILLEGELKYIRVRDTQTGDIGEITFLGASYFAGGIQDGIKQRLRVLKAEAEKELESINLLLSV